MLKVHTLSKWRFKTHKSGTVKQLSLPYLFYTIKISLLTGISLLIFCNFALADKSAEQGSEKQQQDNGEPLPPTADELWDKANKHLQEGDQEKAAQYFYTVFKRYPEDVNAPESLWNTALIRKKFAAKTKDADWERVRNLFRLYINYFPTEKNAADAYLELGKTYYFMRLYREAVSYFKLFLNRYPHSHLSLESKRWLGEAPPW